MSKMNLDLLCARYGYKIAAEVYNIIEKKAENHITKSLGVLQENGVYAFFLYQVSRGKQEIEGAEKLKEISAQFLGEVLKPYFGPMTDPLEAIRGNDKQKGLADDLDDLLLAKRLLEQALIYARYHVKAMKSEQKSRPEEGKPE